MDQRQRARPSRRARGARAAEREVGAAVARDVARPRRGTPEPLPRLRAGDAKAALGHERQIDHGLRRAAADQVGRSGVRAVERVRVERADEQIVAPVAVEVAGGGHRGAGMVAGGLAVDAQAAELVELQHAGLAARRDDRDTPGAALERLAGVLRRHREVAAAVAVEVARRRHGAPRALAARAVEHEAARPESARSAGAGTGLPQTT